MAAALEELAKRLKFGSRKHGPYLVFTGCELHTIDGEVLVKQVAYMQKVLPITIDKRRKSQPNDPLTPGEHTKLRALMSALQ